MSAQEVTEAQPSSTLGKRLEPEPKTEKDAAPEAAKGPQFHEFSDVVKKKQLEAQEAVALAERRKRARLIPLPTNDELVKARLRELGEPIILFGEAPDQRRERLRDELAKKNVSEAMPRSTLKMRSVHDEPDIKANELFYTEGPAALKQARLWILQDSLKKARARVEAETEQYRRRERLIRQDQYREEMDTKERLTQTFKEFRTEISQLGDERPMSSCSFSPNGRLLATSSWTGICRIWTAEGTDPKTLRGHRDRACHIQWHPQATESLSPGVANLVSGGADKTVRLWSLDSETPIATMQGHTDRINRVAWHPSGRWVASTSHDSTWMLWDVETASPLLEQEGHALATYAVGFQSDGGIVATAGLDALTRVWDLRSGKTCIALKGHVKQVLGLDWAKSGYQLATAGEDNVVRIWDLRKKKTMHLIPAHSNLITHLRYDPANSDYILTSSFDGTAKVWSTTNIGFCAKVLKGTSNKMMYADVRADSGRIVTCSYDRTFKIWRYLPVFFRFCFVLFPSCFVVG